VARPGGVKLPTAKRLSHRPSSGDSQDEVEAEANMVGERGLVSLGSRERGIMGCTFLLEGG
jgi:hypothetical protein